MMRLSTGCFDSCAFKLVRSWGKNAQVGSTTIVVPDPRVKFKEDQAQLINADHVAAVNYRAFSRKRVELGPEGLRASPIRT